MRNYLKAITRLKQLNKVQQAEIEALKSQIVLLESQLPKYSDNINPNQPYRLNRSVKESLSDPVMDKTIETEQIIIEYCFLSEISNGNAFIIKRQIIDPNDKIYPVQWWWHEGAYETADSAYIDAKRRFPNHRIIKRLPIFYAKQNSPTGKP